ncbi:MAG: VirE protein, partial [Bacteroidaceae bacterium]|nr:VirE protein [Bacteroidaceae bacterium]
MFGIAKDIRSEVRECTPELLAQALDSPQVARVCAEIEDALEKFRRGELSQDEYETLKGQLKKRLPIITFHATFKNGRRKNDEAIPSGLSIYDLDHIPNPREKWAEIEPRKEELGILLAHISPSMEGLRLVFIMPQGMDLAQAQAWMASQLGDAEYDSCVKDYARCSFVVPREYFLYMSEDLFRHGFHGLHGTRPLPNEAFAHLDDADNAKTVKESVSSKQPEATQTQGHENPCNPCNPCQKEYPSTYEDIEYATIVETLEEQMGGTPEHGSRNNFIFSMACHLRYVCNDDPEWISQILPTYGEAKEKWMHSIRSACARNQTRAMPRIMKRTLNICKQREAEESEIKNQKSEIESPPPMPKRLPPLIKLLVSRTPDIYKPAVANAVFPALGAHLWKTYFRYIDNVIHEATLMNVLMAGTGAGKDCISAPINYILKDIRQRDQENMQREKEWKKEVNSKGANKDKRQ